METKCPHSALVPPFSLRAFLRVFVGKEEIFIEELGEVERRRGSGVSGIGIGGLGGVVGVGGGCGVRGVGEDDFPRR